MKMPEIENLLSRNYLDGKELMDNIEAAQVLYMVNCYKKLAEYHLAHKKRGTL